jgi:hypothetical protein
VLLNLTGHLEQKGEIEMGLFGNFLFFVDRQGLRGVRVGKAAVVLQAFGSPIKPALDGNLGGDSFDGRVED